MFDIEEDLTLDERSAIDFVVALRKRWADTLYPALRAEFDEAGHQPHDAAEAGAALRSMSLYPWFSHIERSQQKMMWRTCSAAVAARRAKLTEQLLGDDAPSVGRLTLDPRLPLPAWYTRYDIHIQPGGFTGSDLSSYVYEIGARVVMLRDNDDYKFHRLFTDTALPEIPQAGRVLDVGCGFGKSTRPLVKKYPDAEVIGIDLAAPCIKLAHREAEEVGVPIHFKQEDATATTLEGDSCDVVTGTMVLHEMPAEVIRQTISEAARVLRPGGSLRFLEFQPTGDVVRDATIYEHSERDNEPYLRDLLDSDLEAMCVQAGLDEVAWLPFDEREKGLLPSAGSPRPEWHFPWHVLTARKPEA
jgi:ubiquinone/menaquinone biosynthesis C-methylase UbiE